MSIELEIKNLQKILEILRSDFKRLDGEFTIWKKKYKFTAYKIPTGPTISMTYRIDIREVNT